MILQTSLPLPLVARGKVRDIYQIDENRLLFLATDRISAFDCILGSGIPCKGRVLTQMSLFWFNFLRDLVPSHLTEGADIGLPDSLIPFTDKIEGRSMLVRKAEMIPVECVARGYLAGSGWKEYKENGSVCQIRLPKGLREGDQLPEPVFTPATKAVSGHDMNIPFSECEQILGVRLANQLRELTLAIYGKAAGYAEERGILLADTKFEFGFIDSRLVLADEVLTPDSSRYWPADAYAPGGPQVSFDKQFVRDYLETLSWDKRPPGPSLPDDVVRRTSEKYQEAFTRITGRNLFPPTA
ncbi:MAG TPA: phosphoribosylaminoimidazolesuccinocarboxamide synthase [Bryobacteraceae bacterium]|nr:phosphoribosylaminoimidazolesuccinocarboxamide synthase [Bryobacteraceae bacterium]